MILEFTGIVGGLCFLLAFYEVASGKWNGKSFYYEFYNLSGGLLLGYYAIQKRAYVSFALNIVWGVVALYALYHIAERQKRRMAKAAQRKRRLSQTT